jgi:hypothetical protein
MRNVQYKIRSLVARIVVMKDKIIELEAEIIILKKTYKELEIKRIQKYKNKMLCLEAKK